MYQHVSFLSQVELQCEWERFASCVSQLRPHMRQHPPLRAHWDPKSWRKLWRRGGTSVFIFDFELMFNNFQYGLKQALQLLIYTLITVVVVMFVAGDDSISNRLFQSFQLFRMNWDLLRLCPLLFTRSCSPAADEKRIRCKPSSSYILWYRGSDVSIKAVTFYDIINQT